MGGNGEGFAGTTMKDTWTKPRGVGSGEGGRDGWGRGGMVGGKCTQMYLNNNKKNPLKKKDCIFSSLYIKQYSGN